MSYWDFKQCPSPGCTAEIPTFGKFCSAHTRDETAVPEPPQPVANPLSTGQLVSVRAILAGIHDSRVGARNGIPLSEVEMAALRDSIRRINDILDKS